MPVQRRLFEMSGLGARPNGENRPKGEIGATRSRHSFLCRNGTSISFPEGNRRRGANANQSTLGRGGGPSHIPGHRPYLERPSRSCRLGQPRQKTKIILGANGSAERSNSCVHLGRFDIPRPCESLGTTRPLSTLKRSWRSPLSEPKEPQRGVSGAVPEMARDP